jgi:hypothetical protein
LPIYVGEEIQKILPEKLRGLEDLPKFFEIKSAIKLAYKRANDNLIS